MWGGKAASCICGGVWGGSHFSKINNPRREKQPAPLRGLGHPGGDRWLPLPRPGSWALPVLSDGQSAQLKKESSA